VYSRRCCVLLGAAQAIILNTPSCRLTLNTTKYSKKFSHLAISVFGNFEPSLILSIGEVAELVTTGTNPESLIHSFIHYRMNL